MPPLLADAPARSARVSLQEIGVPVNPLYVAAAPDGSAYFGFGAVGTGSALYHYQNGGSLSQDNPAPPPSGETAGGGVYGIYVDDSANAYWLGAYFGQGFLPDVRVECAQGAAASLCQPYLAQPAAMVRDAGGVFWSGAAAQSGDGAIVTSSGARLSLPGQAVLQLVETNAHIWGLLRSANRYAIAQFTISGCAISIVRTFDVPAGWSAGSITAGPDGAFWFNDFANQAIGRVDMSGAFKAFPAPHRLTAATYGQQQVTTDCDGNVWFTEGPDARVARIDRSGAISEFSAPSQDAYPAAISAVHGAGCTTRTIWSGEATTQKLLAIAY